MFNIVACNLRSRIYGLSEIDSLYAQMITVKIDFSISTTTSICFASMLTEFHVSLMALEEVLADIGYQVHPHRYRVVSRTRK